MNKEVLVVIEAGGIGQAIARRQGPGRSLLLADSSENTLESAADALREAGHRVTTRVVDVRSRESVKALAQAAAALGKVAQVVHTAGLSEQVDFEDVRWWRHRRRGDACGSSEAAPRCHRRIRASDPCSS